MSSCRYAHAALNHWSQVIVFQNLAKIGSTSSNELLPDNTNSIHVPDCTC